jgi:hypothetical protein
MSQNARTYPNRLHRTPSVPRNDSTRLVAGRVARELPPNGVTTGENHTKRDRALAIQPDGRQDTPSARTISSRILR